MAVQPAITPPNASGSLKPAKSLVLENASNEVVFAVVGYVGSGTSEIATALKGLLESPALPDGQFDVEILKARKVIEEWAPKNDEQVPNTPPNNLATTEAFQDLGDKMRSKGDHAIVARHLIEKIRLTRADKLGIQNPGESEVQPDGTRRAYILDSIRHPAEVELLRRVYQDAFVLVAVVCEANTRLQRIGKKYTNAGVGDSETFMARDARAAEKHGQRVSDAFHMADYFVDNTADQYLEGQEPNPDWDISEKLSRLIRIMTAADVVRPSLAETAMHDAYGAAMQSACLSRQVGAALLDANGNVIATGTNEVPRAGGGVYGESFVDSQDDHRCAYQKSGKFCSNTKEQNTIIEHLIEDVPELDKLDNIRKNSLKLELRGSRVGDLLEFSRAVHAEMDAVFSAARKGVTTVGTRLFVTTFPCHYCARGIVAAGIDEVQYIEPYPKSQALTLHSDAITVRASKWLEPSKGGNKVLFRAFTGVAPRLYRRAFLKDRDLKDSKTGAFQIGVPEWGTPWHLQGVSYVALEAALAKSK
ncbi:anti-phage dCTP deaminase [Bradyrhizobium sp. AZCC 2289]|uniref:anti-phage dCTP deaminase n=1 Tax=Bradyrhizobium sp. AZCC 2289 TaxID=3117026 RepID=UPI002FF1F797